jgi:hypothetical protein
MNDMKIEKILIFNDKTISPYGQHKPTNVYYSSNYDLAPLTSIFVGANIRLLLLSHPNRIFQKV